MLVLDTSALVKRYVDKPGSKDVIGLMAGDSSWCASGLCRAETHVTLCHLGFEDATLRRLGRLLDADGNASTSFLSTMSAWRGQWRSAARAD